MKVFLFFRESILLCNFFVFYISSLRIYSLLLHLVKVLKKFRNIAKFKMILQLLMVLQNISKRLPSSFENLLWSWPKCLLVDSTSNSSLIAYGVANFCLASVSWNKKKIVQNGQIIFREKATAFLYAKWLLINWPFALLRLHILIDK